VVLLGPRATLGKALSVARGIPGRRALSGGDELELVGDVAGADADVEVRELVVVELDAAHAAVRAGADEEGVLAIDLELHRVTGAEHEDLTGGRRGDGAAHVVEVGHLEADLAIVVRHRAGDEDLVVAELGVLHAVRRVGALREGSEDDLGAVDTLTHV
jgi:hypothetical protein